MCAGADSSDALYVFTEALAVAKVGLQLESRGMKWADEHGDADAHRFFSMLSCSEVTPILNLVTRTQDAACAVA